MKRNYSSSTDNFKKLIEQNNFFVDKTLFIKEFVLNDSEEVTIITRPRRFGKSLNMSMLNYFLDIRESSENLFKNFNIWHDKETISHMNKYPVIYFSFKECSAETYSEFIEFIRSKMSKLYLKHRYVLDTIKLDHELAKFERIEKNCEAISDNLIQALKDSLLNLCKYVHNYYKKRVILLIDEYDNPIHATYGKDYSANVNNFFKSFYGGALKGNKYLHRALITGILRLAKENIFSGFNNPKVYTILDKKYSQYFGFTEEEVSSLIQEEKLDLNDAKLWYKGYNVSGTTIYNPFSIINYLSTKELHPYWINSGLGQEMIMNSLKYHGKSVINYLDDLVLGNSVFSYVDKALSLDYVNKKARSFWTLLVHSGYLTPISKLSGGRYALRIPNNEIRDFYKYIIEDILPNSRDNNLILILIQGKYAEFKEELEETLKKSLSYYDLENESSFHSMMMHYAIALNRRHPDYRPKSNPKADFGRADIVIENNKNGLGLVIEIKKADNQKGLKKKAEEGMKQIKSKEYFSFFNDEIKKVRLASIAFKGKQFILKIDEMNLK